MFTKPNILSFLVHNEVFNKFYSILYIYPFMQKMTCITYTTGNAQDWVCPFKL